jgi:hypothetical protein
MAMVRRPARRASWRVRFAEVEEPGAGVSELDGVWGGGRGRLTAPDGEPVAWLGAFVGLDVVEAFLADVGRDGIRGELAEESVEVGSVENGGEVEAHAHAEGEGCGYEGYAQR